MLARSSLLLLAVLVLNTATLNFVNADHDKYTPEAFTCRLLRAKYIESQPWVEYPIIYEPIRKGRLTIWSGVSTMPGSEFKCILSSINGTRSINLNFADYADKLEWTFFDINRGMTYHGITVNYRENISYDVSINNKQSESYFDCNSINGIRLIRGSGEVSGQLRTMCRECDRSHIALVNNLIGEIIKVRLDNEIVENMSWHLTQIIGSQRFSGPIPL